MRRGSEARGTTSKVSRGTDANIAYVFTRSPKLADPVPGPRAAPELARYDRRTTEPGHQLTPKTETSEAIAVLAAVLDRDGQQLSATQTRHQALSDADHLALLHAIWTAETTPARHQRYTDLLTSTLPPGYCTQPSHQARWLWRTLRAAELAGLDAGQILAAAVAERDLAGARDIPSVIDARLRHRTGSLVPLPPGPWSAQDPGITDPDRRAYAAQIAALMDARKDRIGEHTAENAPPWAITALGPVPEYPVDRLDWQRRASSIGAWRELSGHHDPAEPIGPEPVAAAPDLRAAWHEAFAALGPADGPDVRGMPDGTLLHLRDTYPSKPPGPPSGSVMSSVRSAPEPGTPAWPASAPPPKPKPPGATATTTAPPSSTSWPPRSEEHTTPTASARRCSPPSWPTGPTGTTPPATNATSPSPPTPNYAAATLDQPTAEMGQWIEDLAAGHRTFADRLADRQSQRIPSEDPDYGDLGPAFPAWPGPGQDAILQPPKPEIPPSPQVLQRATDRDADYEAAD